MAGQRPGFCWLRAISEGHWGGYSWCPCCFACKPASLLKQSQSAAAEKPSVLNGIKPISCSSFTSVVCCHPQLLSIHVTVQKMEKIMLFWFWNNILISRSENVIALNSNRGSHFTSRSIWSMIDECCFPTWLNCVVLHTRMSLKLQTKLGKSMDSGWKK